MLIFSALTMPPFRSVRLRTRRADCAACGSEKQDMKIIEEMDYVAFCGGGQPDWETAGLLPGKAGERISAQVRIGFLEKPLQLYL
jgi:adenylyltransferase and sulfurtransferase